MTTKKILIISTIFNTPKANKGTSVCNYFAKEWQKAGHNVIAIYLHTNYPRPFYWIANSNLKTIESKTGAIVYKRPDYGSYHYNIENLNIFQIPIFKYIPHKRYTKKSITNALYSIERTLKSLNFYPDIITGHFPNPQIEIVSKLKDFYPTASSAIVMHGYNYQIEALYSKHFAHYRRNIDIWGFRSKAILEDFINRYGAPQKSFICYSGIPEYYLENIPDKSNIKPPIRKFIYCGALIKRKYPTKVLEALDIAYPDNNFTLTYIGEGGELENIKKIAAGRNNIRFLGHIPRKSIIDELDKAECMIMISESEAFGLVYLEAMARGCITIASRNEGMDGIIKNGENGFLCKAGDAAELSEIIRSLSGLDEEALLSLVAAGISTAKRLTDRKVAEDYLNNLTNITK